MSNKGTTTSGIGLGGIVFIIFLVLKLANIGQVANWSWWWVTAPLWLPTSIALAVVGIVMGVMALVALIIHIFDK